MQVQHARSNLLEVELLTLLDGLSGFLGGCLLRFAYRAAVTSVTRAPCNHFAIKPRMAAISAIGRKVQTDSGACRSLCRNLLFICNHCNQPGGKRGATNGWFQPAQPDGRLPQIVAMS